MIFIWGFRLNEKNLIFRLVFKMGCPVFVIAKKLNTSETEIYRFLNGENISSDAKKKLKLLWMDLVELGKNLNKT